MKSLVSLLSIALLTFPMEARSSGVETLKEVGRGFSEVAKTAMPAVVSIEVKATQDPQFRGNTYSEDPAELYYEEFIKRFFGAPIPYRRDTPPVYGFGSGFIISSDGYVITNNHVIRNAEEITVTLNNDDKYQAEVVGRDPDTDLAVLKIDQKNLPFLKLGDSDNLDIGEWVIAIGAPQGLRSSLTVGVVSAKGRNNLHLSLIEEYIQTDAAINPGNSGGPLINVDGELIGVNTALATNTGGYMGISFAIPSSITKQVADQLIANGAVKRAFLGVGLKPITQEMAEAYNLPDTEGFFLVEILENSPAAKAGLKFGDIITKVDGKTLESYSALRKQLAFSKPGSTVTIEVNRNGETLRVPVTLELSPSSLAIHDAAGSFGLEIENTSSMTGNETVVIRDVKPSSPAARAGIRPGSELIAINRQQVKSKQEAAPLFKEAIERKKVLLLIREGSSSRFVSLKLHG